jgi:signal transduction histidine kinase
MVGEQAVAQSAEAEASPGSPTAGEMADLLANAGKSKLLLDKAAPERDRRLEAVAQIAGSFAHDFNNALSTVLGNLQLLDRRTRNDERLRPMVGRATEAARRSADLTKRLQAFAGADQIETHPVDVNAVLIGMDRALKRAMGDGIDVKTVLADDPWMVETDPARLQASILDLAVNAREAMAAHGTLTIGTTNVCVEDRRAEHRSPLRGRYVCVSIHDTGRGMASELIERAFEPFFTTKPLGKGSGIGLSLVCGFIRQSQGHLTVHSRVGSGTRFRLYLPAAPRLSPLRTDGRKSRRGDPAPVTR